MTDRLVNRLARGRLYYGWFIVGVVLSGGIPRTGLNGSFFGIFLKPMSAEFGWTRTEMNLAVTIGTVAAAAMGVYLGRVLDRFGPRGMMAGAFALLAASYFGLALVSTLVSFYVVYATGRSMMQSATGHQLLYATVSKWFVRRRAMAISTATLGGYIGGIALAPLIQWVIDHHGWREAWLVFGVLTVVMAVVPAVLLLRRLPEDLGLLPDGDGRLGDAAGAEGAKPLASVTGITQKRALRTVPFWLLTVMVTANAIGNTGVTFHMVPHYSDVGVSNTAAAASISFMTAGSILSVFIWGYLSDRIGAKLMLALAVATLWLATLLVLRTDGVLMAFTSAAVFGVGLAGVGLLSEVVWADFFGRRYLGAIRGSTIPFQMTGNASGSLIAAFLFDLRGSYDDAFKAILALYALSVVLLLIARRPKVESEAEGESG
jgi:OFA family oxalate/formate antiporter-like MFS transporter